MLCRARTGRNPRSSLSAPVGSCEPSGLGELIDRFSYLPRLGAWFRRTCRTLSRSPPRSDVPLWKAARRTPLSLGVFAGCRKHLRLSLQRGHGFFSGRPHSRSVSRTLSGPRLSPTSVQISLSVAPLFRTARTQSLSALTFGFAGQPLESSAFSALAPIGDVGRKECRVGFCVRRSKLYRESRRFEGLMRSAWVGPSRGLWKLKRTESKRISGGIIRQSPECGGKGVSCQFFDTRAFASFSTTPLIRTDASSPFC